MISAFLIAGCEGNSDVHGNVPSQDRLDLIKVGIFTKQDVVNVLGTPSTKSAFGDDSWYYISNRIDTWAFMAPEEVSRQVIEIDFDKTGRVKGSRTLTLNDGKDVAMNSRETPTAGQDFSVLEQLLGNLGKFNNNKPSVPGSGDSQ